eukprot:GHVT01093954.1.p1 GENE.GHVT01093954.1~~GHVT01093954.1.p1  ORF type:complete len:402 (+),score=58.10 GHVT01093954.1:250-1455(+)
MHRYCRVSRRELPFLLLLLTILLPLGFGRNMAGSRLFYITAASGWSSKCFQYVSSLPEFSRAAYCTGVAAFKPLSDVRPPRRRLLNAQKQKYSTTVGRTTKLPQYFKPIQQGTPNTKQFRVSYFKGKPPTGMPEPAPASSASTCISTESYRPGVSPDTPTPSKSSPKSSSSPTWSSGLSPFQISPWHDVPLYASNGLLSMVVEIPKFATAKMEINTKLPGNPIIQDIKNGALRHYRGPIYWNYGALPQTWENPDDPPGALLDMSNEEQQTKSTSGKNPKGGSSISRQDASSALEVPRKAASQESTKNVVPLNPKGDNDPLDVVEVGAKIIAFGAIVKVKALGGLCLIDEGEIDWKIIAIQEGDPNFDAINNLDDLDKFYPATVQGRALETNLKMQNTAREI